MSTETIITGAPAAEPSAADASFWKNNLRDYGLLVSLLLIMAFSGRHRRRAVPRRQRDQPHPAEQLHRHHGARNAAGDRRGQHRSVGRLIVGFVGGCAAILMVGFHVPWVEMDVNWPWQLEVVAIV